MSHEWTEPCRLDGCEAPVEIVRRPDGRYRVRHGEGGDEADVRFYTSRQLFVTDGYRGFALERHAEARGA